MSGRSRGYSGYDGAHIECTGDHSKRLCEWSGIFLLVSSDLPLRVVVHVGCLLLTGSWAVSASDIAPEGLFFPWRKMVPVRTAPGSHEEGTSLVDSSRSQSAYSGDIECGQAPAAAHLRWTRPRLREKYGDDGVKTTSR